MEHLVLLLLLDWMQVVRRLHRGVPCLNGIVIWLLGLVVRHLLAHLGLLLLHEGALIEFSFEVLIQGILLFLSIVKSNRAVRSLVGFQYWRR